MIPIRVETGVLAEGQAMVTSQVKRKTRKGDVGGSPSRPGSVELVVVSAPLLYGAGPDRGVAHVPHLGDLPGEQLRLRLIEATNL